MPPTERHDLVAHALREVLCESADTLLGRARRLGSLALTLSGLLEVDESDSSSRAHAAAISQEIAGIAHQLVVVGTFEPADRTRRASALARTAEESNRTAAVTWQVGALSRWELGAAAEAAAEAAIAVEDAVTCALETISQDTPPPLPPARRSGRGRALVVEDDPVVGSLLHHVLTDAGWEVEVVTDGETASQRELCFDVVVVDLDLPGRGGHSLLTHWREDPTPLVVLSARAQEPDRAQSLSLGARAHLEKPFSPAALLRVLEEVRA